MVELPARRLVSASIKLTPQASIFSRSLQLLDCSHNSIPVCLLLDDGDQNHLQAVAVLSMVVIVSSTHASWG